MSYFDDASLVMIPSGYKTSKVYSVKPTDGSGDLTFSRSNDTATRVNSAGLIEKVRTNQVLQSNTFSNASWTKTNATVTGGQAGYDGTTNAWLLSKSGSLGRVTQDVNTSGLKTFSLYAKAGTTNWIAITFTQAESFSYFNISNGTLGTNFGSDIVARTITSVGSGWYRVSISVNNTSSSVNVYVADSDGTVSGTSGNILIQAAQIEGGDIATDYIATTSAAVSVGPVANVPRLDYLNSSCPRLLLEPQRTNLALFSEQINNAAWGQSVVGGTLTITPNYGISPDGYQNADRIQMSVTTGYSDVVQVVSTSSGTAYTYSVYLKSLSGTPSIVFFNDGTANRLVTLTTEWKRYTFTISSAGSLAYPRFLCENGVTSASADFLAWGAQLEAGAYATSYIPTLGAAVTRGADAASKNPANAFFGTNAGTIFVQFDSVGFDPTQGNYVFDFAAGADTTNRILVYFSPSDNTLRLFYATTAGVTAQQVVTVTMSAIKKIAVKWDASSIKMFYNGTATNSFAFGASAPNDLTLFARYTDTEHLAARSAQLLTFPTTLTDAQCIELTTL